MQRVCVACVCEVWVCVWACAECVSTLCVGVVCLLCVGVCGGVGGGVQC